MNTEQKPGGRILVVDDESEIREMLVETLTREGYQVTCAAHGAEALEHLRRSARPGLILLDLMMPVMDGWEFLKQKKLDPLLASIPVVVMSGIAESVRASLTGAAVNCLSKPVDRQTLCGMARLHCRPAFRAPAPPASAAAGPPATPPSPPASPSKRGLRWWMALLRRS